MAVSDLRKLETGWKSFLPSLPPSSEVNLPLPGLPVWLPSSGSGARVNWEKG